MRDQGVAALAAAIALCGAAALAWAAAQRPGAAGGDPAGAAASTLLREGARLEDQRGRFRHAGGRTVFIVEDGGRELPALENLALERVEQALEAARSGRVWLVSGMVTEYRGANYLLISRARMTTGGPSEGQPTGRGPAWGGAAVDSRPAANRIVQ